MPAVVKAAIFVGKLILGTAGNPFTQFLARAAFSVALSVVTSKLFGPKLPKSQFGLEGRQVTVQSALEYRKIVYGEAMLSGPIVYQNLSGNDGEWLWYVIALCDGEIDSFQSVWLDGDEIPIADIDYTPGSAGAQGTGSGNVSTSEWVGQNSTNAVRFYFELGHDDQVANTNISNVFTDWTNAHRGRGVAWIAARFLFDADTEEIWNEKGQPRNIKPVVRGRKIYDPRRFALNSDPDFETALLETTDPSKKWWSDAGQTNALEPIFSVASGVLSVTNNDDGSEDAFSERFPVDTSKRYTVRVDARQTAGDRRNYLGVAFYDSNGDLINNSSTPVSDATGWGGIGSYHYFHVNAVFTGSYVEYTTDFGSGGTASIPTGAVEMACVALLTRDGAVGTETTVDLRDFAIHEYGSGTRHEFTDVSTWEWTNNGPVCWADYKTQFQGALFDEINWDDVITEANFADELVLIPPASPTTEQKRFTCNGVLSMGESHRDNELSILSSFDGRSTWLEGKWRLRGSRWIAPTVTIDGDWLTEDEIDVQGQVPRRARFNNVRGFFIDPDRNYEAVEFPPVSAAAYVARDDGKVRSFDLELPMTNNVYMAQRLGYRLLEQGNNQIVAKHPFNFKASQLAITDTVNVDLWPLGWTATQNHEPNSEDFSTWDQTNVTVTDDAETSPFGTEKAARVESASAAATTFSDTIGSVGNAGGMAYSVYVKRGSGDTDANRFGVRNTTSATDLNLVAFDYSDGSFSRVAGTDPVIVENLPNGWYRINFIVRSGISNNDNIRIYAGFTGASEGANEFCFVYGAQLYDGVEVRPYIKTTGSAVTKTVKTMRVVEYEMGEDGRFPVTLKEDDASDYVDPLVSEYALALGGTITPASVVVAAPSSLAAAAVIGGINLTWTDPASRLFDSIEVWASDDNDRANATQIATVPRSPHKHELPTEFKTQYYWIRARRDNGQVSAWHPTGATSGVSGAPLPDFSQNLIVDPDFDLSSGFGVYWDENESPGTGGDGSVAFNSNAGANSSNAVDIVGGNASGTPSVYRIITNRRFRYNFGWVEVRIRYQITATPTVPYNFYLAFVSYSTATGGTGATRRSEDPLIDSLPDLDDDGNWHEYRRLIYLPAVDAAQFWTIEVGARDGAGVSSILRIDSVAVIPTGAPSIASVNEQNGDYTFAITDVNKTVRKASGGAGETYTIPANSATAFEVGSMIAVDNDGGGDLSIAITTDTLRNRKDGTTGTQTLPDGASAVLHKVAPTLWNYTASQ